MLICCVILMISHILDQQCDAIFEGREVVPHSRPYMVLIETNMGSGDKLYCPGFLLNEDYVMTAANCQAESYIVSLGVHNTRPMNDGVQNITVERAFPHKSFHPETLINNMMLLKLSSKAKFNNRVGPISISGQGEGRQPRSCSVSGWRLADWDDPSSSPKLREIDVTLIDHQRCVKKNSYCSRNVMGDYGNPLVCDGYAFGVASGMSLFPPDTLAILSFSKLPDSRKLAELFLDRRPVCGRAADSNKKFYVKDEI